MTNTQWWGAAHILAILSHLVMGIVALITFNNTAIKALQDFSSGLPLVNAMDEASLVQGATAVGVVGFVFNLGYFSVLLWRDHKISVDSSPSSCFRRKIDILIGVILGCGFLIGDITLAAILGLKGERVAVGLVAVSSVAGFMMALTIAADLFKLHVLEGEQKKVLGDTVKDQQQA